MTTVHSVSDAFIARLTAEQKKEAQRVTEARQWLVGFGEWLQQNAATVPLERLENSARQVAQTVATLAEAERLLVDYEVGLTHFRPALPAAEPGVCICDEHERHAECAAGCPCSEPGHARTGADTSGHGRTAPDTPDPARDTGGHLVATKGGIDTATQPVDGGKEASK